MQVIDTNSNNQIWSETFDGEDGAAFQMQDDIGRAVLGFIAPEETFHIEPANAQISDASWDAYLYGRFIYSNELPRLCKKRKLIF